MEDLDWRWVKSFTAVAAHENLGAAAEAAHTSAPTLSRHIAMLEDALGVELFDRGGRGLKLSTQGAELLEHARRMGEAAATLTREATGLSTQTTGSVRVSMTETFGAFFAPAWIESCRHAHPGITIELQLDDDAADLLLHEADIAVRLFEPRQGELVMKRCGTQARGFYASPEYLERRGTPTHAAHLETHELIGFDRSSIWRESTRRAGLTFGRDDFTVRTDSHTMHPILAAHGLGVAVVQHFVARRLGLVRILLDIELFGSPVFLVAHPSLRSSTLVSKIWRHLDDALTEVFER